MPKFTYVPDENIKVHGPGVIKLICAPYQTHENGLPEWPKNAADASGRYEEETGIRLRPEDRAIVLLFADVRDGRPASIACLDLVGTTGDKIEKHFRHWGDPEAARQGTTFKSQGGHGNGGKCYMTQLFSDHALLHTVHKGRGCRYGVQGGSVRFGWVPDSNTGRDYPVDDIKKELNEALRPSGITISKLPKAVQDAIPDAPGFTLVRGVGPKPIGSRIKVKDLLAQLRDHPQMLQTLEYCTVYVVANGKEVRRFSPLRPSDVEPMAGVDGPRTVAIPEFLVDPLHHDEVSTTNDGKLPRGSVELLTSRVSMRWSKKARHTINYFADDNYIGYRSMLEFDVRSGYRDQVYGLCRLDALEDYKTNDRSNLAESPLTRAVEYFLAQEIQKYCEEFEAKDRRKYSQREKNALSEMNQALDKWKNRFLKDLVTGTWGPGDGPPPPEPLPAGIPASIELTTLCRRIGRGVAIRPTLKFFDKAGLRIRSVPYRWVTEDPNIAMVDDDLMIITSFSHGTTVIHAETLEGDLRSNRVPLEVVHIHSVEISPGETTISVGGRRSLTATCTLASGEQATDVGLVWTESDTSVARVSATGTVFAVGIGETDVGAGDDSAMSEVAARITVVKPEEDGGKDQGNERGKGFPRILVSGDVDLDPDTNEPVRFSREIPPVWQRPSDVERNIWWINSASPLASLYLDRGRGFGYDTREWRMYHLERYIEIITQIAMTYDPAMTSEQLRVNEWILNAGSKVVEIQAAAAADLVSFIEGGVLP